MASFKALFPMDFKYLKFVVCSLLRIALIIYDGGKCLSESHSFQANTSDDGGRRDCEMAEKRR